MTRTTSIASSRICWLLLVNLAVHASVYSYSSKSGDADAGSTPGTSGLLLQDFSPCEAGGGPLLNGFELASSNIDGSTQVPCSERDLTDGSYQPSSQNAGGTLTGVALGASESSLTQQRDAYTSAYRPYSSSYKPSSSNSQLAQIALTSVNPVQSSYLPGSATSNGLVYSLTNSYGSYTSSGTVTTTSHKPPEGRYWQITDASQAPSTYQTDFSYASTRQGGSSTATTSSNYQLVIGGLTPTQPTDVLVSSFKPAPSNYESVSFTQNTDFAAAAKPVQSSIQGMPNQQPLAQCQGPVYSQSQYKPLKASYLMTASQPGGSPSASSDIPTQNGQSIQSAQSSTSFTLSKPTQTMPSVSKPFQSGDLLYQQDFKPMSVSASTSEGCSDPSQDVSGFAQSSHLASESNFRPMQQRFQPVSFTKPLQSGQGASRPILTVNPASNGCQSGSRYQYWSNDRRLPVVGNERSVCTQQVGSLYVQSGVSQDHGSTSVETSTLSSAHDQGSFQ